jgi:hypothetical protein
MARISPNDVATMTPGAVCDNTNQYSVDWAAE